MKSLLTRGIKMATQLVGMLLVILLAFGICYGIVIVRAILDIKTDDPIPGRYRFPAHLPDGHMLCDETGHALLFDSRKSAAAYAAQYKNDPPDIINAVEQACQDYTSSSKSVRTKKTSGP